MRICRSIVLTLCLAGCSASNITDSPEHVWFAGSIAGQLVEAHVITPPGGAPVCSEYFTINGLVVLELIITNDSTFVGRLTITAAENKSTRTDQCTTIPENRREDWQVNLSKSLLPNIAASGQKPGPEGSFNMSFVGNRIGNIIGGTVTFLHAAEFDRSPGVKESYNVVVGIPVTLQQQ